MIKVNCEYNIKEDIDFILESEKMNILEFSEKTKVSRTTLDSISKNTKPRDDVYEKYIHMHMKTNIELILLKKI